MSEKRTPLGGGGLVGGEVDGVQVSSGRTDPALRCSDRKKKREKSRLRPDGRERGFKCTKHIDESSGGMRCTEDLFYKVSNTQRRLQEYFRAVIQMGPLKTSW